MFPFFSIGLSTAPYRPYPNAATNPKINYIYRDGATSEMMSETMRHYKHAAAILAAGGNRSSDNCPKARTDFGECDFPRVEIFGDIWVRSDNGITYPFTINICNEWTTADMLISAVWELVEALGGSAGLAEIFPTITMPESGVSAAPAEKKEQSPQAWADNAAQVESTSASGTLNLGQYDNEKDYSSYHGKVVSFDICKLVAAYTKTDGKQYFEAYGYYKGKPSKYPIYGMNIYPDNEYTPEGVKDFVVNISGELVAPMRVVVYVNVKGDKTYFNTQKIEEK